MPEHLKPYQFKPGQSGNPKGRKPGQSMKQFAKEFLQAMDAEEKIKFMNSLDPNIVWRMAEGQPHNTTDVTSGGKPIPVLGGQSNVQGDNSNPQDSEDEQASSDSPGRQ